MFLDLFEMICYLWLLPRILLPFGSAVLEKLVQISDLGPARTRSIFSCGKLALLKFFEDFTYPAGVVMTLCKSLRHCSQKYSFRACGFIHDTDTASMLPYFAIVALNEPSSTVFTRCRVRVAFLRGIWVCSRQTRVFLVSADASGDLLFSFFVDFIFYGIGGVIFLIFLGASRSARLGPFWIVKVIGRPLNELVPTGEVIRSCDESAHFDLDDPRIQRKMRIVCVAV